MATADRTLMLKLIADVNQPTKQMKGLTGTLKKAGSAAKSWGKAFAGALVIGGIEKLVDSLDDAVKGFNEGEDAARDISATWKRLGADTDRLAGTIGRLGDQAVDLGFDDTEVLRGFNLFLTKTGNVEKSQRLIARAMDVSRGRGISLARAIRLVSADLDENDRSLKRNRGAAARWAQHHPIARALSRISEGWETFIGNLTQGNLNKALAGLGDIGSAINDLLFGAMGKGGKRTGGLIDRFVEIGRKLVPALIRGLSDLGNQIALALGGVDWVSAIRDGLNAAMITLQTLDAGMVSNIALVGAAIAVAMFAVEVFATALGALLSAPKLLAHAAVTTAISVLGSGLAAALRAATFLAEGVVDLFARGLAHVVGGIPTSGTSTVGRAGRALGRGIQGAIIVGLVLGFLETLKSEIDKILDQLGVPRLESATHGIRFNKETGKWERFAQGGIVTRPTVGLLGEAGPEAVIPLDRMGSLGGITVNITTGVGDPVAIGREVDRVLRQYRARSGTHIA